MNGSPLSIALVLAALAGCVAKPAESSADAKRESAAGAGKNSARTGGPAFIPAGPGEIPSLVTAARSETDPAGQQLVVYVGATWCEPCQAFHQAVEAGELDASFPDLRLLEFDLDEDRERLAAAGYSSRMIPLFVVPGPDGRAGPRRMQGGIKGPGAVDNISERLAALLEAAAADAARQRP